MPFLASPDSSPRFAVSRSTRELRNASAASFSSSVSAAAAISRRMPVSSAGAITPSAHASAAQTRITLKNCDSAIVGGR
jgi:hypothetical protein